MGRLIIQRIVFNIGQRTMDSLFSTFLITLLTIAVFLGLKLVPHLWSFDRRRRYSPIVGPILYQLYHDTRLYDYHTELSRRYRTFRFFGLTRSHVYVSEPANVEYILKTNFENFGKGKLNSDHLDTLLGEGIFVVDGEKWRHQRKISSYQFSTKTLRDFSSVVFRQNASRLAGLVGEFAASEVGVGIGFDIQEMFKKSTLDSIFKVGFGVDLNVISGSSGDLARCFDEATVQVINRFIDPLWKLKRYFNIGSEASLKRNVTVIDDFVYKVIRNKSCSQQQQPGMPMDILSRFMAETDKDPEKITDKYLRDIIFNFILAGRDTTAGTLSWFIYILCKHPDLQQKLRCHVAKVTGVSTGADADLSIDDFTELLTDKRLGDMHYLHAALTETLRLYPSVPLDGKECFSDDILPDGYAVRKGDLVNYQPYPMGRMEYVWGHDAEEFRVERWLDDEGVFQPESPFKFTAFQSGPRICLGKEFAYLQMKITAATLLFFFNFRLLDERKMPKSYNNITLLINGGLHVRATTNNIIKG